MKNNIKIERAIKNITQEELAKLIPEVQGELQFNGVTDINGYSVRLRYSMYSKEVDKFPAERSLKGAVKIFSDKHGFKFAKEKIIIESNK